MPRTCPSFPWFAVTGAPSSGKTTVVQGLNGLGFAIVPEAARELLEQQRRLGLTDARIADNQREFHDEVLRRNAASLAGASPRSVTFFDRTLLDSIAYGSHYGWPSPVRVSDCGVERLRRAFIMDPLPWCADGVRYEGAAFAHVIDPLIERTYRRFAVPVTRVPVADVPTRIKFVLAGLEL